MYHIFKYLGFFVLQKVFCGDANFCFPNEKTNSFSTVNNNYSVDNLSEKFDIL